MLAKGGAKGSAEKIGELGRELGLAGARPPLPQGGSPSRGGDRQRKSTYWRPTGGEVLAQRERFGLRRWKGAPRVQTTGGTRRGRPPEDDGTHAHEATARMRHKAKPRRRARSGGKGEHEEARHEELAKAPVEGTTHLESKGVESFPEQPTPRRHLPWQRLSRKFISSKGHRL